MRLVVSGKYEHFEVMRYQQHCKWGHVMFVVFPPASGAEAVYGTKRRTSKGGGCSGVCRSLLRVSVSRLQVVHHSAALSNLVHAAGHHECHAGAVWQRQGAAICLLALPSFIYEEIMLFSKWYFLAGTGVGQYYLHLPAWGARMPWEHD